MRIPFQYKLGFALVMLTSLTSGASLYYFYKANYDTVWQLMSQRLNDIAHTGYFLFHSEERDAIQRLKEEVEKRSLKKKKEEFDSIPPGETIETLAKEDVEELQSNPDFHIIVQALRKIKIGTTSNLQPLKYIKQLPEDPNHPPQIRFAYIISETGESSDRKFLKFIADADYEEIDRNQNGQIDDEEKGTPIGTMLNVSNMDDFPVAFTGKIVVNSKYVEDKWGMWVSTTIPILDVNGKIIALLGLDLNAKGAHNNLQKLKYILIAVLAGVIILSIFMSAAIANVITRPIKRLKEAAEEVQKGNYKIEIKNDSKDEIGELTRTFKLMVDNINNSITEIESQKTAFYRFVPERFLGILNIDSATKIHLGDKIIDEMTVLFSDIRSFTSISENLPADEVYDFLNRYFQVVTPVISANGGFVDKYMGDGIMAIFSRPKNNNESSADLSVKTSIRLMKELNQYNAERLKQGQTIIKIGIGLNTGQLILGTVGTEDRLSTTVVGNTVNLASRLEGLTSHYRCDIIVSSHTIAKLEDPASLRYREIDTIIAKGMTHPCEIYEVFNHLPFEEIQKRNYSMKPFMEGLLAYKLGEFKEAKEKFSEVVKISELDSVAVNYLKRVESLIQNPPLKWDPVVKFDTK
ncbi:MAG: adenylate/guanylate cyclase domain-containing protein [Leptospiraceae bacterium]|nr:adenylate/guanylate cyclase domain-containing protein [Leptospiraceae bacterium]